MMVARDKDARHHRRDVASPPWHRVLVVAGVACACILTLVVSSFALDTPLAGLVVLSSQHGRHGSADATYQFSGTGKLDVSAALLTEDGSALTDTQRAREFTFTFLLDQAGSLVPLVPAHPYPYTVFDGDPATGTVVRTGSIASGSTFTLRPGQHLLVDAIPKGALYQVTTQPPRGYALKSRDTQGHLIGDLSRASFTLTTVARSYSSLTIMKAIEGTLVNPDQYFELELTLDASMLDGFDPELVRLTRTSSFDIMGRPDLDAGIVQAVTFTEVAPSVFRAQLTIQNGQALVIENLPLRLRYTCKEIPPAGFTSSVLEARGVICDPDGVTVPLVNHAGQISGNRWTITIPTTLIDLSADGSADPDTPFAFTLTVKTDDLAIGYQTGSIVYTVTHADGSTINDVIDKRIGSVTVPIKAGDEFLLTGTSTDRITYTLAETGTADERYVGSIELLQGTIRNGQNLALHWDILYDPVGGGRPATLFVTKALDGVYPCPLYPHHFEIAFDSQMPIRFTLTDGETLEFPTTEGTHYRVTELIDPRDGYGLVKVVNGEGTASGSVLTDGVTVTNRYLVPITTTIEGQVSFDVRGSAVALPATFEVALIDTRNGSVVARDTTSASEEWMLRFEDIELTDAKGRPIGYTLRGAELTQFTETVEQVDPEYFMLVETYLPPVTVNTPYVLKTVVPANAPVTDYTFKLAPLGGAPLPPVNNGSCCTATVTGTAVKNFGSITFTEEGTYEYRITEVAPANPAYSYDKTVYALIYEVTLQETAEGRELVPTATLVRTDTNKPVTSIGSKSTYTPTATPPSSQPTTTTPGNQPNRDVKTGDASVRLIALWLGLLLASSIVFSARLLPRHAPEERA